MMFKVSWADSSGVTAVMCYGSIERANILATKAIYAGFLNVSIARA